MNVNDPDCKGCEKQKNNSLPKHDVSAFAKKNDLTGALGASFGMAVDSNTAGKIATRLGGKSPNHLMKFIETPGTNAQKKSMSERQKRNHIINSVGLGNFSLNSTYETGLVNSISGARATSSDFLKNSKTGSSLVAASALGIGVPGGDMLGIGSSDTPMFKIFKLAAFGLKLLCASLRGKSRGGPGGYTSDTESILGLVLSLGIDLSLLDRLKSIFDKILGLKENFSTFGVKDLNIANSLFNLCDWIENMEYGSSTLDSLRNNLPTGLSNKTLTELAGKKLIGEGTYDTFARNDFGFDQQFKSIAGDIDALKCDACKLGNTDIKISSQGNDLFNLQFDARTGLKRDTGIPAPVKSTTTVVSKDIEYSESTGGIDYVTEKLKPTTPSSFNRPVTQEEINEYTPSEKEKDVMEDLSAKERQSFIKENVRAKRQLEEMVAKRKATTNPSGIMGAPGDMGIAGEPGIPRKSISTQVEESVHRFDDPFTQTPTKDSIEKKSIAELLGGSTDNDQIGSLGNDKIIGSLGNDKITTTLDEIKTTQPKSRIIKETPKSISELKENIKKSAISSHDITESSEGVKYVTDSDGIVYDSGNIIKDTYQNETGDLITDTWESDDRGKYHKVNEELVSKKPYGGPPADPNDTSVISYHTGETIKKEDLIGTVLEDADLNKVALLAPTDLENLKNTEEVENTLSDAEQKFDEAFETEIEKTENLVLEQQSDGIIFGVQLPTILNGNQIVINSERVLISAKTQEMGLFSKRKFFITTDDEITMNCKQRFVVKTDQHASIEAPTVHLGTYTTRNHPSLKGDCTVWWLQDLCDWLSSHCHSDPYVTTSTPVQQGSLAALKARTPTLLSERIFISG